MNIVNFEKTVIQHSHSLFSMKRVCEPSSYPPSKDIISRCHQGLKWNPGENATENFSFLTSMMDGFTSEYLEQEMSERGTRSKRFIISTPIIVGTVIGAASIATAGATAAVIANAEVQGVVEEEKLHRIEDVGNGLINNNLNLNLTASLAKDVDTFRTTEDWSSHSVNTLSQSKSSNNELNHLFSRSGVFEFSDPMTEKYYTLIKDLNSKYSVGLTNAVLAEKTKQKYDNNSHIPSRIISQMQEYGFGENISHPYSGSQKAHGGSISGWETNSKIRQPFDLHPPLPGRSYFKENQDVWARYQRSGPSMQDPQFSKCHILSVN